MTSPQAWHDAHAEFRGLRVRGVVETADPATEGERIAGGGLWVVVADFEGRARAWRFAEVERGDFAAEATRADAWSGPAHDAWVSSLSEHAYQRGVEAIRRDIRAGEVYQVNLCRVLEAPLPGLGGRAPDAAALSHRLAVGNPARFASRIVIPPSEGDEGAWIVSASPELYLRVVGEQVTSAPIKGTAAPGEHMLAKDEAENIMITDLIRNDLSHVAFPGSVRVPELLGTHDLPGLSHLQSTVAATLAPEFDWTGAMWPALFSGTFPPGSVSGAPKSSALHIIAREEPTPRGPYCGAIGWIDADEHRAELAVGIRTFWWTPEAGGTLRFGTGAGITWGSEPAQEWAETELKARRLIALASAPTMGA